MAASPDNWFLVNAFLFYYENQPLPTPDQPLAAESTPEVPTGTPHYGNFGHPAATQHPDPAAHPARRVYVGGYIDPSGEHGCCPVPGIDPT